MGTKISVPRWRQQRYEVGRLNAETIAVTNRYATGDGTRRYTRRQRSAEPSVSPRLLPFPMESNRVPAIDPPEGLTLFWKRPSGNHQKKVPKLFPIIWPHEFELPDSDEMTNETFPHFLLALLQVSKRLYINLYGSSGSSRSLESYPEAVYMMRNLKYLKVKFMAHSVGGIDIDLKENHATNRKLDPKYRAMYPRAMFTDHVNEIVVVVGEEFQLTLHRPLPTQVPGDFPDGNGEIPLIVGTYLRALDTQPHVILEWRVALYTWYNKQQAPPAQHEHDADP